MRKAAFAAAVALVAVAGCSQGGAPPSGEGTATATDGGTGGTTETVGAEVRLEDDETGEPVDGGTLRMLLRLDADKLDPHVATDTTGVIVGALVYEGLVENVRGEIVPALAQEWEMSDDGTTYTFTLREGATFHGGRTVTSEDVAYSLARVADPETLSPSGSSYAVIESVDTPDESTVVLNLSRPHAPMLAQLASLSASVVDREVVEAGGLGVPDGGTGPFVLAEHNVGRNIVLTANADYWNPELPHVDGIDMTWNPDDNARAAAIRSGDVDVLFRPAPEFIDSLKSDSAVKWYGGSGSLPSSS
ncbi:ABC transporter substrate-binding protein [Litorihabitans aurantiacus]|uniref:ABC transporter substrate-binding protein n=1 Tax=Litorihabitans aurantiacus TaxID=1930061 RepID=UPI003D67EE7A